MIGWIKLTKYEPDALVPSDTSAVYVNVDQIQSVYEEVEDNGDIITVIDLVTGRHIVSEEAVNVLQKIKLARPTRT
ncbi:MAG: hypothetical protein IKF99_03125 [Oscillospiraceae bacterium]|nr:hypothetical protein [Oscillospiraceae bacterium]